MRFRLTTLLACGFRGELAPTEADLARREGRSYEPASVLPRPHPRRTGKRDSETQEAARSK